MESARSLVHRFRCLQIADALEASFPLAVSLTPAEPAIWAYSLFHCRCKNYLTQPGCIFIHVNAYSCIMSKLTRQQLILQLIENGNVASQEDLRRALVRHGQKVTQATLSRDIHELGIVKTANGYARANDVNAEAALPAAERLVREFVLSVREAQNQLVIKTSVGSAQPVAAALDAEGWEEMLGTIAGDDTILIICENSRDAERVAGRIREMLA